MERFEEKFNKDDESRENTLDYFTFADKFFVDHGFVEVDTSGVDTEKDGDYRIYKLGRRHNVEHKSGGGNELALRYLQTPEFLKNFFEDANFKAMPAKLIVNKAGSTLFMSAGVQILDSIIHEEKEIFSEKIYVAQPVFRTQFIDKIGEGISSSFINIATEMVNKSPEEHFMILNKWMQLLEGFGLNKENMILKSVERYSKWGKRRFSCKILKIHYNGWGLGDAAYIDMPQDSRNNISISDIGFGLERIKWLLSPDKSYFQSIVPSDKELVEFDSELIDYVRTLTLLAGSGVKPSNNAHGYRFRQLSKLLTKINLEKKANLNDLISIWYDDWRKWTDLPVDKENSIRTINLENERNFNRELLDILKKDYPDVGIDINQPTTKVIELLNGTSVDRNHLREVLNKIL